VVAELMKCLFIIIMNNPITHPFTVLLFGLEGQPMRVDGESVIDLVRVADLAGCRVIDLKEIYDFTQCWFAAVHHG